MIVRCATVIQKNLRANHRKGSHLHFFVAIFILTLPIFVAIFILTLPTVLGEQAFAGSDKCAGGGFTVLGLSGKQKKTIPASSVGSSFLVKGKYVEFTVDAATFGIRNYTLNAAPNSEDITGALGRLFLPARFLITAASR